MSMGRMGARLGRMGGIGGAGHADPLAPNIFVFAGQSNNVATGTQSGTVPAPIAALGTEVQIWNWATHAFVQYVAATNSENDNTAPATPQRWGPEGEFARLWCAANPGKTCYIVKRAQGGTQLGIGAGSDWNEASNGEYFDALKAEIALAITALTVAPHTPRIRAISWMQGETDSLDGTLAAGFQTALSAFAPAALAEWGDSGTILTIGRISASTAWTFGTTVRDAQIAVAAALSRVEIIDTDDIPLGGDNQHYTVPGITTLGGRFYDSWRGANTFTDAVPAAFTITDLTDQAISTLITSNNVVMRDLAVGAAPAVTFSGTGEFQVYDTDGTTVLRAWGTGATTVGRLHQIQLRMTTSASNSTAQTATLTVGGVSDTWSVTTVAAGVAFSLTQVDKDSISNITTNTFVGKSFGAADATRRIVVGVSGGKGSNTTLDISSVTIGGVSATLVTKQRFTTTNCVVAGLYIADVPTGTTGDVVVTFNEAATRVGIGVFRLVGAVSATASDTDGAIADASNISLTIPAGGGAIAYGMALVTGTCTPTGYTEAFDEAITGTASTCHSGGTNTSGSGATTMGMDWSAVPSGIASVYAAWSP